MGNRQLQSIALEGYPDGYPDGYLILFLNKENIILVFIIPLHTRYAEGLVAKRYILYIPYHFSC